MRSWLWISILSAVTILGLYQLSSKELSDPEPMEMAQVARNVARGRGLTTDIARADEVTGASFAIAGTRPAPDSRNPPLFPIILGLAFSLFRTADSTVCCVSLLFHLLSVLAVAHLAKLLASKELAVAAALGVLLSPTLLGASLHGYSTSLAALLLLLAFRAVIGSDPAEEEEEGSAEGEEEEGSKEGPRRMILAGLSLGFAGLTQYSLLPVVLTIAGSKRVRISNRCALVLSFLAAVSAWLVRNKLRLGSFLATARWQVMLAAPPGDLARRLWSNKPVTPWSTFGSMVMHPDLLAQKYAETALAILHWFPPLLLEPFLLFCLLSPLFPLPNCQADRVKWRTLGSVALVLILGFLGSPQPLTIAPFLPLCILTGCLTLDHILSQQFTGTYLAINSEWCLPTPVFRRLVPLLLVGIGFLSFLLRFSLNNTSLSRPKSFGEELHEYRTGPRAWRVLITDSPACVAWHGDTTAIWLPSATQEQAGITSISPPVDGVYLTGEVMRYPARYSDLTPWKRIYTELSCPEGFPRRFRLSSGAILFLPTAVTPGSKQTQ